MLTTATDEQKHKIVTAVYYEEAIFLCMVMGVDIVLNVILSSVIVFLLFSTGRTTLKTNSSCHFTRIKTRYYSFNCEFILPFKILSGAQIKKMRLSVKVTSSDQDETK
ncbi:hypothetical protein Ahy_A02g008265 isoform A [Arachis hypogaea]|uniref:Uncharacterized protein n=1 Tax=Arachis hypogaea TaxID=3818 RepID=A0A445EET4_ARAHY|nr:hypothetical protein Ahy_A02g008265 isoform A [Arachis hypogaea]